MSSFIGFCKVGHKSGFALYCALYRAFCKLQNSSTCSLKNHLSFWLKIFTSGMYRWYKYCVTFQFDHLSSWYFKNRYIKSNSLLLLDCIALYSSPTDMIFTRIFYQELESRNNIINKKSCRFIKKKKKKQTG